jgi:hypothetical protein
LATIPALVARKWCIDEARIYLTGQSDGGMAADAIAPNAAGVNGKNLAEYGTICGGDQSHSDLGIFLLLDRDVGLSRRSVDLAHRTNNDLLCRHLAR